MFSVSEKERTETGTTRVLETPEEVIDDKLPGELNSKRGVAKRRKSEDELELHPALDWEEEREGGRRGGGGRERERPSRERHRGPSEAKSLRGPSSGTRVSRSSAGEREGGDGVRSERRRGGRVSGSEVKLKKEEMEDESLIKPSHPIKVIHTCIYIHTVYTHCYRSVTS